mgnify:CR=1 FL=1
MAYIGQAPSEALATSADIGSSSVTTAKIADGAVTAAKLGTVYAANISGLDSISVANTQITGKLTSSQIIGVANTQITGNVIASQITSVANTQITGNVIASQITSVANTQITGIQTISQGGTNNSSFTSPSGNVSGLVFYNGTNLTNDATVTDIGYDTSTHSLVVNNSIVNGSANYLGPIVEKANISASGAGANITLPTTAATLYFTGNATSNSTINFTGLSGITTGNVASFVVLYTNNTNPKYITTVQVDGDGTSNVTTKWSSGAPTSGTANIDVYSFNVVKTSTTAYTVLGAVTNFK